MERKPRILFVMHMPPPVHGAAMMGAMLHDCMVKQDWLDARFINLSASASVDEIGRRSWKKVLFIFRLLREVRHTLGAWKPDLVYVTPTSCLPALLKDALVVRAAKRSGCRILLHFHNKGVASRSGHWLDDRVYRRFFAGTKVILLSERLTPDVEKYVKREDILYCPNGLELPAVRRSVSHAVPRLLFLSNLLPGKGVVDLLDACRLLKRRNTSFLCRFVGAPSGSISAETFRKMVEERGLEGIVLYEGPLYGNAKLEALGEADMLVHPTREDCFPLVILEAMAAGLPVVSTREGAIPDEVEDGITGILCDKGNPEALADAIETLLQDNTVRERMGAAGRIRYETYFTRGQFEKRMIEILRAHV